MTFTEAAIEVLRREGKPLHYKKIAEIAVREGLLDHVGKIPEEVMGGQLAAHSRLPHADRRVLAVQSATFALVEWGLDEDPHALEEILERPAENEPPLRPKERHPIPSREMARGAGRGEARARRREEGEERRGRRFPPPAEVAYEILVGAERPMSLAELGALGAERFLMPDAFVRDTASLAAALLEDNRRRESAGRRPLFGLDADTVSLVAQPEPGEQPAPVAPVRATPTDFRRVALATLRRRIRDSSGPTVEYLVAHLLERMGLRDVKVAKRGREQVVFTGRKKIGLGDVRHCVRVLRTGADVGRREVQEVRRDLGHYGAQMGLVVTAGDASREARGESAAAGQLPVILLCGEALAESFTEVGLGCQTIQVPVVDEAFFRQVAETAEKEDAARRARREERDRRDRERPPTEAREPQGPVSSEGTPSVPSSEVPAGGTIRSAGGVPANEGSTLEEYPPEPAGAPALSVADENEEDEGDDEPEGEPVAAEAAPSTQAEGERRRRRRRRRRGGRGRGRERVAAPAAAGLPAATGDSAPVADGQAAVSAAPAPPEPRPASGEGEGNAG
jgi:ribonuclease E